MDRIRGGLALAPDPADGRGDLALESLDQLTVGSGRSFPLA